MRSHKQEIGIADDEMEYDIAYNFPSYIPDKLFEPMFVIIILLENIVLSVEEEIR